MGSQRSKQGVRRKRVRPFARTDRGENVAAEEQRQEAEPVAVGTNYYLKKNPCPHCGRAEEEVHIGKSSGGWCFALHVYPEDGINDMADWLPLLTSDKNSIRDEYGQDIHSGEMLCIIRERETSEAKFESKPYGYDSWTDFHVKNHSFAGPRGLLRHKVERGHCIKNGEGTWDCIVGDFS